MTSTPKNDATLRPLGAQISHMLKARGVDTIFGIPGVHNIEMYRGIEEAGITHILARHEQGAGFMADGYARASGKPGVAYVITGPGLCNAMTAMGQAYSDSVPLLVISSCLDETSARRGQLHQMRNQELAAETVSEWSYEVRTPAAAYALIDRAFSEFATTRPRTRHIQVPIALGGTNAAPAPAPKLDPIRARASGETIADVAQKLAAATRPLFVFGGGATHASDAARRVVAHSGAATFTTYAGRGITDPNHPLSCGATLGRLDSIAIIAKSDLVIVVGSELAEVDLWRADLGHTGEFIRVDIDPEELDHPRADIAVMSDAAGFMADLAQHFPDVSDTNWNAGDIATFRARARAETDAERPGIVPICDALAEIMPDDTMYYSDMTQFAYVAKEVWDMDRPGHWHHPFGFGTLGYALPAAIGGAVARPGLPTVCIAGDYGFQYTIQDLGTAVELGLPIPIILWDNGKLKEIEDSMINSQIAPNAVVAQNPDFLKLADAYGAYSCQPKSLAELQDAVRAAFLADAPTLIRIVPEIIQ